MTQSACQACGAKVTSLDPLPVRDFDGSIFNFEGVFLHCTSCGFVRVESGLTDSTLARYYSNECLYSTLSGVGVGGDSKEDITRYDFSVKFMKANNCISGTLADIGCSRGGFIRYLAKHMPSVTATGVDCDLRSLGILARDGHEALEGDVFQLPFGDNEKDLLSYFHVFEHLYDVDSALQEARRVLKPQGILLIEVPDASSYFKEETYVGPMFWLGMKEHVNHFTSAALLHFLKRHHFQIVKFTHSSQPMKGNKKYPSLMLLAKKSSEDVFINLDEEDYTSFPWFFKSDVAHMRKLAEGIVGMDPEHPICFWGIGLEFFALYGYLSPLLHGRTVRFVDRNSGKLAMTIDGIPVTSPEDSPIEGQLVCCSYMSEKVIRQEALALGWPASAIRSMD
jgi:ubiquinone/menaquinone biosynthesis C-methylase UbiE